MMGNRSGCVLLVPLVSIAALAVFTACTRQLVDPPSAGAPPNASFMNQARESIAAREYHATGNGEGLQAPNRAHELRTYFETTGIRVHDRTAEGSPSLLGLSLTAIGRGEGLVPAPPGDAIAAQDGRVEVRRPGLVEWYVNSEAGLEQGFTLDSRPPGEGALVFELTVAGAHASMSEDAIVFEASGGLGTARRLRYDHLVATDASRRPVAAHFEVPSPDRVRIVVDESEATYPLLIDPILTGAADRQLESNQASAAFGESVAGAGDVNGDGYADVIVGAYLYDNGQADEGAAFVFLGGPTGITASNPSTAATVLESNQIGAAFGYSVAAAGDVDKDGYDDVIVGSYLYDKGSTDEGAAFVFRGSASGIANANPTTAAAVLESNQTNAQLGYGVAGAGDVNGDGYGDVIVGAYLYDNVPTDEGAAFVFHGGPSGIVSGSPVSASGVAEGDQASANLGMSVASAGDVNGDGYDDVIVGAPYFDPPGAGMADAGGAFILLGSANGLNSSGTLLASTRLLNDQPTLRFGESVGTAGDTNGDGYAEVVVGAIFYQAGQTAEGAAFVFSGGPGGVPHGGPATASARLESNQTGARMGACVGSAGDVNGDSYADVLVGAYGYDSPLFDAGAAFVFLGSRNGIANGNPSTAAGFLFGTQSSAFSGYSAAGAGDVDGDGYADVVVGSFLYDGGQTDEGAAFVYLGGARGIRGGAATSAAGIFESNQAQALLGFSVDGIGDLNGDGYSDVVVGAPLYDGGQTDEGAAFIFLGGAVGTGDGNPLSAATVIESDQASASLGISVSRAGDVNGDGYADVIVGASGYDHGEIEEGMAFLFHGGPSGIVDGHPGSAAAVFESNQVGANMGWNVADAGDVNGDGYADVIVGASGYDKGESDEGAAFVFLGRPTWSVNGAPSNAAAVLESNEPGAHFGTSLSSAGDVNGDGFSDVIVGNAQNDRNNDGVLEGAAFVFHGSISGISSGGLLSAATILESNQNDSLFGSDVTGGGDLNGDGFADVAVGSSAYDHDQADEGAVFTFLGSTSGIADGGPFTAASMFEADLADSSLGRSVANAGDVNGDGYADLIAGATGYRNGQLGEGGAFVLLGSATGVRSGGPAAASAIIEGEQISAFLGPAVAGAGDVDGDGAADVVVGAHEYIRGQILEGAAFVFLGNGGGRPGPLRQRRGDGSGIAVQPFGLSRSTTSFAVSLSAGHPQGSGRVKAQFQACPSGTPFGSLACTNVVSPTWLAVDAAAPDVSIAQTITGLTDRTLYRWRARVLYAPRTGLIPVNPPHGPWRHPGALSQEADIRVPEPGSLGSLAAGLTLLASWARRRRERHAPT